MSSITPLRLGLLRIIEQHQHTTGTRVGFPKQRDHDRFSHIVELEGLCREKLGHVRFCAAYRVAIATAVRIAPRDHLVEPVRDPIRHALVGYEFGFATPAVAQAFSSDVMVAMAVAGVV